MNMDIFEDWFNNEFVPSVQEYLKSIDVEEKAILLLDNAPSHVKFHRECNIYHGKGSKIWCVFLPPNTTSVIQPMDQGVLDTLKRYYRKKLMRTALSEVNDTKSMVEVKKNITIHDAINWAAEAWAEERPYTIYSSWKNILPHLVNQCVEEVYQSNTSESEEDFPLSYSVDTDYDELEAGHEILNDDEIIVFCKQDTVPNEEPIEEVIPMPNILPMSEAFILLQYVISTLENDPNSKKEEIVMFRNVLTRWKD